MALTQIDPSMIHAGAVTQDKVATGVARNKEHLRIMLAKNIFADYDTTEIEGTTQ